MSTYCYKSGSGEVIEREFPIGKAPKRIGKFVRFYTPPVVRQLSSFERGTKPSMAHSLPRWYGYGQRETCWKEKMEQLQVEDTPHRRQQVYKAGLGPKPREIDRRSRLAAAKAGALGNFDKKGTPVATNMRGIDRVLDTAKRVGDDLKWNQ